MLKFIGTGSAFHTELGNTSAFLKKNTSMLLIDCGGTVFSRIMELDLLDDVKDLYVIITHTHPDHVGSLGELIFYANYYLEIKPTIFFPNKELMHMFLSSIGITPDLYELVVCDMVEGRDTWMGQFCIEFRPVSHVDTIQAYGAVVQIMGESFFYSGDSNHINVDIMNRLIYGTIDRIYQDTCGLDFQGNNHLSLRKLCNLIPREFRDRVFCMHLDRLITEKEITERGFQVAKKFE